MDGFSRAYGRLRRTAAAGLWPATLAAGIVAACSLEPCSYGLLTRDAAQATVGCCGASTHREVSVAFDHAGVDLALFGTAGAPVLAHAWLTATSCERLFEGEYPPPAGAPVPLCPVFLGPVAPGEVSERRSLPRGDYRIWVQAFSSAPASWTAIADIAVWGEQCGNGRPVATTGGVAEADAAPSSR